MRSGIVLRLLLVVLAALVAGRYLRDHASVAASGNEGIVKDLLLESIQRAAHREGPGWEPVTISRVRYDSARSGAVPGLTYRRAVYADPRTVPSNVFGAVVAEREGVIMPLLSRASWGAVVAGWSPRSAAEAERACAELFSAGDESLAFGGAIPWSDQATIRDRLFDPADREAARAHAGPAAVTPPDDARQAWRVRAWVLAVSRPRRLLELECTFPTDHRAEQGPSAIVRDSVALTAIPYL